MNAISFRASGDFLAWLENQRIEGESLGATAQRILKTVYQTESPPPLKSEVDQRLEKLEARLTEIENQLSEKEVTPVTESTDTTETLESLPDKEKQLIDEIQKIMATLLSDSKRIPSKRGLDKKVLIAYKQVESLIGGSGHD